MYHSIVYDYRSAARVSHLITRIYHLIERDCHSTESDYHSIVRVCRVMEINYRSEVIV